MEIRIEHTTDYPWDLLLLADPNRELVDSYLKTSDCFAAFSYPVLQRKLCFPL